jgi:uncharacterized protein YbbC (DUF1343 family)
MSSASALIQLSAGAVLALCLTLSPACRSKPQGTTPAAKPAASAPGPASENSSAADKKPVMGAEQLDKVLPLLKGKRVGLVVNHTSVIGKTHLLDTLLKRGVQVKAVFGPEHGFRGEAEAGALIASTTDKRTGVPVHSLYGKTKKPSAEQIKDLDVLVFDIQDVGARFYTYISTMHYIMDAAAEFNKEMIVLDRPNPSGHYVDGPIREESVKSFVSLDPIPIVHGMTVGELAKMINGEKWLNEGRTCRLTVVPLLNYTHQTPYELPIKPSPNLPTHRSVLFYPSLCLFEGTNVSIGRGTLTPFEILGSPTYPDTSFHFTPQPIPNMDTQPVHKGVKCYGKDLRQTTPPPTLTLAYLLDFYQKRDKSQAFFKDKGFAQLAGTPKLQQQIEAGMTEEQIKATWQADITAFRKQRKPYLLYKE